MKTSSHVQQHYQNSLLKGEIISVSEGSDLVIMPFLWLPWSISVTQHSSRAPDGLWTFASITPLAPLRLTANDAGWFTFKPDSCSTTHTYTFKTVPPTVHYSTSFQLLTAISKLLINTVYLMATWSPKYHMQVTYATIHLTWRSLTRLKRRAVQWKDRSVRLWKLNRNWRQRREKTWHSGKTV